MTDLRNGIIEIDGMIISRSTKASDFENISNSNIDVQISKRGHTYVKFKNPIVADSVPMYVTVACYSDSDTPEIGFCTSIPDSVVDYGYGEIPTYLLKSSKKWLKAMLGEPPTSESNTNIYYKFNNVDYYASTREDIHYGTVGGSIEVSFHEE